MNFFDVSVINKATGERLRGRSRPLAPSEVGVWLVGETNDCSPGERFHVEPFGVAEVFQNERERLDAAAFYGAGNIGDVVYVVAAQRFYRWEENGFVDVYFGDNTPPPPPPGVYLRVQWADVPPMAIESVGAYLNVQGGGAAQNAAWQGGSPVELFIPFGAWQGGTETLVIAADKPGGGAVIFAGINVSVSDTGQAVTGTVRFDNVPTLAGVSGAFAGVDGFVSVWDTGE